VPRNKQRMRLNIDKGRMQSGPDQLRQREVGTVDATPKGFSLRKARHTENVNQD